MIANYQPQKQTLTLVGRDNIPISGFIGTIAEQKAKQLSEKGILVFTIETKMKHQSKNQKTITSI